MLQKPGTTIGGFFKIVDGWSRPFVLLFGSSHIFLLGVLDYLTGYELSFAVFYVVPVAFIAWHAGFGYAVVASVASAVSWHIANTLAGETYSSPLIPYWNATARLGFFLCISFSIHRLREALEREKKLARCDYLTGALNSRAFHDLAEQEIDRSRRYGTTFTLAYFDVDNFKQVNDEWGHSTGDAVLRTASKTIQNHIRSSDTLARLGGDEFAILLPQTSYESAQAALGKIQKLVLQEMQKNGWPVTLSIGAITCGKPPANVDDMIRRADTLMYSVKHNCKAGLKHELC